MNILPGFPELIIMFNNTYLSFLYCYCADKTDMIEMFLIFVFYMSYIAKFELNKGENNV